MKVDSVDKIPTNLYKTAIDGLNKAEVKKKEAEANAKQRQPGEEG
jgi:hypothetical protein